MTGSSIMIVIAEHGKKAVFRIQPLQDWCQFKGRFREAAQNLCPSKRGNLKVLPSALVSLPAFHTCQLVRYLV